MDRRHFIVIGAAGLTASVVPGPGQAAFAPQPDAWRRFELVTRIDLPPSAEPAQVWVPVPAVSEPGWMKAGDSTWRGNATSAERASDPEGTASFVHAKWSAEAGVRTLTVTSIAMARDRNADLSDAPGAVPLLPAAERRLYTASTDLIPTDGIVKDTADGIVGWARSDLAKAQRIYDWIVENTARNPETRGCGLGDVASMLAMGDLTGKCADLNALYVGLARAAGLPARDVYGLRVAPSAFGYKSLGAGSNDVTKAQHCRAEVWLEDFGWVAVDPADVRKVMLEEPPKDLPLDHPKVTAARDALFGGWEGNWIGYNFAHDVVLPGATNGAVPFLMYPEGEVGGRRLDPLDPASFSYTITARELPIA
ncbi:Transglutaminase-like enzyme, putative cysteine protease [Palleronia marisminoris]|uniref:Transglutaminase-like superfamily protein n=1 Tax=Palleronia marisminoris TaxID=315423 RepID=A0A1Y5S7W3_9RHOB|nr:transglutaminase domain-containing protein [Palleronia marisminoris]SFG67395.1 Transglutaminase-like enzyme, putative cysteine protease [Palleronia marisminoris]SLN34353.1 Transglutaminase-like superfamily protein [Palleronia marisminoris]